MLKKYLLKLIFSNAFFKEIYIKRRIRQKKDLMNEIELQSYLEEAEKFFLDKPICISVGLVRDSDNFANEGLVTERAYFPKYERFLKNNQISYSFYDPFRSNWMEEAEKYDLIIWHTDSDPSTQEIAESKIYILEKMGIKCFPSYDEIWSYESKVRANYLYKLYDLPTIPTYISHSKQDTIDYLKHVRFPIISKISTGSASFGVDKINDYNEAKKVVDKIFSYKGKDTYFKYQSQKNYVYFQEYIEDATFDLRVICIGDELFGYYRYPNKGDFRASGAGNYEKKEIPNEALELAYKVREKFGSTMLATDFVYSEKKKKYFIIESSIFIGIDTCEQLCINGVSGKYKRLDESNYQFIPGKYWIQEVSLKSYIEKNIN
ncbi:RimK family alpha-L-glutamate ligase [Acinetobacter sp. YH01008]|uniref:ATP-grasp domain-containing protein n=1 Tax=Acinetobacter sp. YH01008 TaxID=2601024 RepID=UPI0015D150D5|nr:hypothetical protein [Acinetobacter sp. YH01008]